MIARGRGPAAKLQPSPFLRCDLPQLGAEAASEVAESATVPSQELGDQAGDLAGELVDAAAIDAVAERAVDPQ